ncbi:hypothetical protein D3C76_1095250 [compost metagenome]
MVPGGAKSQVANRLLEFDADHQPLAANRQDIRVVRQLGAQPAQQLFALVPGVVHQRLLLNDVQHRAADPTGQRITAERTAMAARGKQLGCLASRQAGPNGHTVAQAFGQGHDVRHDALVLEREPLAGTTDTGLDLVEHQQPGAPAAQLPQGLEVTRRGDLHTALALDRLHQYRDDALGMSLLDRFQRREIAERHLDEIPRQPVVSQPHRRAVTGAHRAQGAPVERIVHDHHQRLLDALVPTIEACQFQCGFVGLGA